MRVAIVAPWLTNIGGAEKVLAVLAEMYPQADIFSLFGSTKHFDWPLSEKKVRTSFLNRIPAIASLYRPLIWLQPAAVESLDLRGYDLVLSCDAGLVKGVLTDQRATHICYCHTPVRYIWDSYREFLQQIPLLARPIYAAIAQYLRLWDFNAAQRVDLFIANSKYIQERIAKCYRRDSVLIYPPVATSAAGFQSTHDDYYLSVGRLSRTKHIDLLIQACNQIQRRLCIVGQGREEKRLRALAGPTIEFLGSVDDSELSRLYANCRAFLFAAEEDFGIVPVEAQAHGRPVLAYGRGGVLETVNADPVQGARTGMFFQSQTVESLVDCILDFESQEHCFEPAAIHAHAQSFDTATFRSKMGALIHSAMGRALSSVEVPG